MSFETCQAVIPGRPQFPLRGKRGPPRHPLCPHCGVRAAVAGVLPDTVGWLCPHWRCVSALGNALVSFQKGHVSLSAGSCEALRGAGGWGRGEGCGQGLLTRCPSIRANTDSKAVSTPWSMRWCRKHHNPALCRVCQSWEGGKCVTAL